MQTALILLVAIHVPVMLASLEMEKHAVCSTYHTMITVVLSIMLCEVLALSLLVACTDGHILLYNGTVASRSLKEGTVLVCYNNTYGTVCDDRWDELEARIVCADLGYVAESKKVLFTV